MIEEMGSEIFQAFLNASRPCQITIASRSPIFYKYHLFSGGIPPRPRKDTPPPPKGAPAAVSRLFKKVKTSPRSDKVRKINPDNSYQEIANGLPWLSYAGGLGDGSPPVLIILILCLLKAKAKKSTLLKCK